MAEARGWGGEWGCLEKLWDKESHWNERAMNRYSGAYGIPQALPGSKMASAGADWQTNPATQIKWGLNYIAGRYKSPCGAWAHSQATGWY
ncbi:MAG: transglycosylase SLT domain-containing protein [Microbispora sp.]|nr:transglycosylase SLT domain-containing protein [Microbispora sp.]